MARKSSLVCVFVLMAGCLTAPTATMPGADEQADPPDPEPASDSEDDSESEGGPPGSGFVPEADVMLDPECEDLGSDECGPGRKCTLAWTSQGELTQVCADLVDDPLPADSPCELGDAPGEDACAADAVCWDAGAANGMGTCLRFCNDINDWEAALAQCGEGFTCNYFKSLPGDDALCTPTCMPLQGDCPGTCGCFWANAEFLCVPLTENIATGQPCGFVNDCAMDHLCADAAVMPDCEGSACCASYCRVSEGGCAQAGTQCVSFFEEGMAPPGLEDVGICILPDA